VSSRIVFPSTRDAGHRVVTTRRSIVGRDARPIPWEPEAASAASPVGRGNGTVMDGVHGVVRKQFGKAVRTAGLGIAVLGGVMGAAMAQDAKPLPLKLELNRLEPAGESCRTYLLVDNSRGPALKSLKVDLFAFDTEGVAQKRLAVELGPVPDHKTLVRLFDFPALACPKIGRVLLNDVLACEGADASRETCLERIETDSKTSAPFVR
jgi:hypothetical protein